MRIIWLLRIVISSLLVLCVLYFVDCFWFSIGHNQGVLTDMSEFDTEKGLNMPSKYNLMEDTYGELWKNASWHHLEAHQCTVEYANDAKLEQDHPCVLHLIRSLYLRQPAPTRLAYHLNNPERSDPSDGQAKGILRLLRNQTNGFFIECGSFDGEYLSNTLFMERSLQWTGLLVEADREAFEQLVKRNRKAYMSPACLSTMPYPIKVIYNASQSSQLSSYVVEVAKHLQGSKRRINKQHTTAPLRVSDNVYQVQCFPLYSMLLAIGKTEIDYFSLDVEGSEFKILSTIPWHLVNIKTITVEWNHAAEGEAAITRLMESNKFVKFSHIEMAYSREIVYVKDFFNDLRLYE